MPHPELHVIGIDPGGTTGWARITIPRNCMYGDEPTKILEWDCGEVAGPEPEQAKQLSRLIREAQGLSWKIGAAVVIEDWDVDPRFKNTDPEFLSPVRIGAMLTYAKYRGELGDAIVTFQGRTLAKQTATDERLREWGFWVSGSAHERDAIRHAITALRRAKARSAIRSSMWATP